MSADGSCIKEGISMVGKEYSVLKEDMKLDECGWSKAARSPPSCNQVGLCGLQRPQLG
jgi:hypothetical protein